MRLKRMMQFGGVTLIAMAIALAVRTGGIAILLNANAETGLPFWFQLSFMRMFAAALAGLGAVFLWSASRLSVDRLRSLVRLVAVVFGGIGSITQQIAIWNSTSGWARA